MIDKDLNALLEKASANDGKVLLSLREQAKAAALESPTSGNLAALDKANRMLEYYRRQAGSEHQGDQEEPDETFPHKLAAWEYLRDSGWQIGRSQFYEHCKQGRLPRKDGGYLRVDVDRYAENHCKLESTGEKVNETLARQAEEKSSTELEREKVRLARERHELAVKQGKVVDRDAVEQMIVGRAIAMLAHLKAMVQMKAGDWIEVVEGNQSRSRELIETIQESIEGHIAVFAKDIEFEVIFEKNSKGEDNERED